MSFVSIHDSLHNGPKLRRLYKRLKCSKGEAVGILCFLWGWGMKNAERTGRIIDADLDDIVDYIRSENIKSKLDPEEIVRAFIDLGWIDRKGNDLYIHDWDTWQEPWYKAIDRKKKDVERKRNYKRNAQGNSEDIPQNDDSGDNDNTCDTGAGKKESPASRPKYEVSFEAFWDAYPRKIGKGEAYKKYQTRRKDGFSDEQLLLAAKNYAASCKRSGTQQEYIKHPRTFLSDNLPFLDYLPRIEEGNPTEDFGGNPFEVFGGMP